MHRVRYWCSVKGREWLYRREQLKWRRVLLLLDDQCGFDLGKGFNPPLLRSGKREAGEAIGVEAENWPDKESESQNAREAVCMKSKRSVLGTSKKCPFQMKDADASRLDVIFPLCA